MKGSAVCVWTFLLLVASGCPEVHGRGGLIDQAVEEDMEEQLQQPRCSERERNLYCPGGKKTEECIKACGE